MGVALKPPNFAGKDRKFFERNGCGNNAACGRVIPVKPGGHGLTGGRVATSERPLKGNGQVEMICQPVFEVGQEAQRTGNLKAKVRSVLFWNY